MSDTAFIHHLSRDVVPEQSIAYSKFISQISHMVFKDLCVHFVLSLIPLCEWPKDK